MAGLRDKFSQVDDKAVSSLFVAPDPKNGAHSRSLKGVDHTGKALCVLVVEEKPLTLYLNSQEIVTMMTIGDYPEYLALGYLFNQNMLTRTSEISSVDYDEDLGVVVVRTPFETNFEEKLKKKTRTSGCAQGTVFGDLMDGFEDRRFSGDFCLKTSWLYPLLKTINTLPSLYLSAGAIHGCVLCERDRPLVYMEDVGRHNAVDKISGWMMRNGVEGHDKIFYTTGRLTSEMVIKTALMGIPILVSRSGFTAWGVELARSVNMTLIGRARGRRFQALSGEDRIVFDCDPQRVSEEPGKHRRKGAL